MKKILLFILICSTIVFLCCNFVACGEDDVQGEQKAPDDDTDNTVDGEQNGTDNENEDSTPGNEEDGNVEDAAPKTYSVKLESAGGMALYDVEIFLYCPEGMLDVKKTNYLGEVDFVLPSGEYSFEIDTSMLEGYDLQAGNRYDLAQGINKISLTSKPIAVEDISSLPIYELGDIVHDFSITDIDGKTYTVSEILEEKELLVLNFWYVNCNFCVKEFPYLCRAYDKYADSVEVLAINDYGDALGKIKDFEVVDDDGNTVAMNFPRFKLNEKLIDNFDSYGRGYPVTVCIDRYGMISMVHVGGILSEEPFEAMFEFYTKDDYRQTIVDDMDSLLED